jgi:hypothetical protein
MQQELTLKLKARAHVRFSKCGMGEMANFNGFRMF